MPPLRAPPTASGCLSHPEQPPGGRSSLPCAIVGFGLDGTLLATSRDLAAAANAALAAAGRDPLPVPAVLARVGGVRLVNETFFNEFTLDLGRETRPIVRDLAHRNILAGVSLGKLYPDGDGRENGLVVAVTETTTPEDVEALASALEEVLA